MNIEAIKNIQLMTEYDEQNIIDHNIPKPIHHPL